jgi:hypothetical protein
MLIVAQPVAMLCHAIGGVLLALLVGGAAVGREIDRLPAGSWRPSRWRPLARELDWKAIAKRLFVTCWPLLTTVLVVVLWKTFSPEPVASMNRWRWDQKAWSFVLTLRDRSLVLDAATTIACFGLILCGWLAGARWSWRQGLPGLLVLLLFVAIPSDINGSAFVDIRLLPVAAMLLLALQDWSRAKPSYARAVAYIGMALLGVRAWWSPGPASPTTRRTTSASLPRCTCSPAAACWLSSNIPASRKAGATRGAITWPALPASIGRRGSTTTGRCRGCTWWCRASAPAAISPPIRPNSCGRPIAGGRLRSVDSALKYAPIERVDYVWLIDTGLPRRPDPRLQLVWQDGRSLLCRQTLGFSELEA